MLVCIVSCYFSSLLYSYRNKLLETYLVFTIAQVFFKISDVVVMPFSSTVLIIAKQWTVFLFQLFLGELTMNIISPILR